MEKTNTLTSGNLPKQILLFSLPLMVSSVLQVLFNISDVAVVGRFAGWEALGAVGSTTTLVSLFIGLVLGIAVGVNVPVARQLGARDADGVRKTVHTACLMALMTGFLLLAVGMLGTKPLLVLLGTKPELIDGAMLYLHIYFLGTPALALFNFGSAVLSAAGDTRRPLVYLLISGVLNVVLNLFFVIVCKLGIAGVAIASDISQYLSAILILTALFRSKECYALRPKQLCFSPEKARELLRFGVPAAIQNAIFQVANLFIQASVNTFDAATVSGIAAASNADPLVYDVMAAFYTACAIFMGQNFGANKRERVLKSYFICLAYSLGTGLILGLSLILFHNAFLGLFATDPAVIAAGWDRLRIMGYCYAFSAFMDCTIAASRGIGKSLVPTLIVILGSCVFRIVWVYTVFACFRTLRSLYLLYIFSWGITAIAEMIYFAVSYRKITKNAIIL